VGFVKYWFSQRIDFIDSNFLKPPVLTRPGGSVTNGTVVQINAVSVRPNTTIYYTLDGTDPRLPGGAVSPSALSNLNSASITLTQNVRVFARNYNLAHQNLTGGGNPPISTPWSSPTVATFVVSDTALAITEIMYNPAPPASSTNNNDNFEFIELKNVGTGTIALSGIRFTQGLDFTFGASGPVTQLAPGQYAVLVRNQAAFASRYPGVAVAGVFTNQLNNGGERITLEGALQEPILSFEYDNQWYPATDGQGFSLVLRNENASDGAWTNGAAWRASTFVGGSPGQPDPAPVNIPPVLINEALTHTDPPQVDAVELYNPTTGPAAIGGWFLTDDPSQPKKVMIPAGTWSPLVPRVFEKANLQSAAAFASVLGRRTLPLLGRRNQPDGISARIRFGRRRTR
jgi:hypothetical protein